MNTEEDTVELIVAEDEEGAEEAAEARADEGGEEDSNEVVNTVTHTVTANTIVENARHLDPITRMKQHLQT